ncbi:hypothetical protein Tco_1143341 [Tanacetum coccineum]
MFSCNSTRVASSSSVIRPKSKDTNSKKRVLLNTKSKSTSKDVKKSQSSVSLVSNKCDTMHLNVSESNTNVLKAKTVNVVHDGSNLVIQIFLWIVDSGVHMTVNLKLLRNFVEKFMGTVHFGNDNFAALTGYGDYVQGNLTICHVYYVEGLRHNLFLIGQLFVGDLEVAFNSNTCYVRNLEAMASECNNLGPGLNYSNFQDSSIELNEIPSKEDLDNLFGPLYEEYYATRTLEVSNKSATNTLNNEDTLSYSSIIVEDYGAPQIVSSSE